MANEKTGRYPDDVIDEIAQFNKRRANDIYASMQHFIDKVYALKKQQRDELEKDFDELRDIK